MSNNLDVNKIRYIDCTGDIYPDTEEGQQTSIQFSWGIEDFGFGTTTFYYKDGVLKCDNETMSKDKIKQLLCAFVDKAEFIS